jgi:hypothetical protein
MTATQRCDISSPKWTKPCTSRCAVATTRSTCRRWNATGHTGWHRGWAVDSCCTVPRSAKPSWRTSRRTNANGCSREPGYPTNTITSADALEAEIKRVRELGYAVDDEENEETIRCLGAPLLDRTGRAIGGVSISTITFQVSSPQLLAYAPKLVETARILAPMYT